MYRKCRLCVLCSASQDLCTQPNALYVTVDSEKHKGGGVRFKAHMLIHGKYSVGKYVNNAVRVSV